MNGRQAKRLRKENNYKPCMPRQYVWRTVTCERPMKDGGMGKIKKQILELHDADRRVIYQEAKKEFYAAKSA